MTAEISLFVEIKKKDIKDVTNCLRVINTVATRLLEHYRTKRNNVMSKDDINLLRILFDELDNLGRFCIRHGAPIKESKMLGEGAFTEIERGIIELNDVWNKMPKIKTRNGTNFYNIVKMRELVNAIRRTIIESLPRIGQDLWD